VVRFQLMIWWQSGQHFVDQNAQRIPVYALIIPLLIHDLARVIMSTSILMDGICCPHLWCEVVWSTTQSPGSCSTDFGKSKISYLDMSIRVQQDILRFEVAIYDPVGM